MMILWTQTHLSSGNSCCWVLSKLSLHVCLFFNSEEITYKPTGMSLMGRMIKMKKTQALIRQNCKLWWSFGCSGKYEIYFPSDGEIVYMHPDYKDVVFLTWELINVACTRNVGWVNKVHYVYCYITMLSFIMIKLMINAAFLCTMIPPCRLYASLFFVWRTWLIEFIFNSFTIYIYSHLSLLSPREFKWDS